VIAKSKIPCGFQSIEIEQLTRGFDSLMTYSCTNHLFLESSSGIPSTRNAAANPSKPTKKLPIAFSTKNIVTPVSNITPTKNLPFIGMS
jgi:hypothetical protein